MRRSGHGAGGDQKALFRTPHLLSVSGPRLCRDNGWVHPEVQARRDHHQQHPSPELGELAKLLETTYLGILIAWAQEVERLAAHYGGKFEDVNAFVEEIDFLPSGIFPGRIGGHCVMPNIAILRTQLKSKFLDTVVESNETKEQQLKAATARDSK